MKDTAPEAAELFHNRLMALSGEERLKKCRVGYAHQLKPGMVGCAHPTPYAFMEKTLNLKPSQKSLRPSARGDVHDRSPQRLPGKRECTP